jgi:putative oxidoreductase
MNRFLSTKYSAGAFNFGMLVLRVFTGILLVSHGYAKLVHFNTLKYKFMDFLHLGSTFTLCLVIFAELFCSIFLILGLFTRFACIPIIIAMTVVVFIASNAEIFDSGEKGMMYLVAAVAILFCGPGKISVDGMIGK